MTLDRSYIGYLGFLGIDLFKSVLMYSNGAICLIKLRFKMGLFTVCTISPWTFRQCSPNLQNSSRVTSLSLLASLWPRQLADWRPIKTSRHCKAGGQSELGDCFSLLPDIELVDSFLLIIYGIITFTGQGVAGWLMRRAAVSGPGFESRGRIFERYWDKSLQIFPPCYSQLPSLTDFTLYPPSKSCLKLADL